LTLLLSAIFIGKFVADGPTEIAVLMGVGVRLTAALALGSRRSHSCRRGSNSRRRLQALAD